MADITRRQKEEMDISAVLSTLVYLDIADGSTNLEGMDLNTVLKSLPDYEKESADYQAVLKAIEENPSLGDIELISQSGPDFASTLVDACAFRDPYTGNVYVSYRGTGDGKWVDNGEGLTTDMTIMQETAVKYFDSVVEDLSEEQLAEGRLIVTGHSKGGNEAQLVFLMSENRDRIDNCYSLDGQGFSKEAISKMNQSLGTEQYEEYLQRIYSINGENDYVHDLGHVIIPQENTYFIPTPEADSFDKYHSIRYMLNGSGLNWSTDENGKIIKGEQGLAGIFAKNASEELMALDQTYINAIALTVMTILEKTMKYPPDGNLGGEYLEGTGNRKACTLTELLLAKEILFGDGNRWTWDWKYDFNHQYDRSLLAKILKRTIVEVVQQEVSEFFSSIGTWMEGQMNSLERWFNNNLNSGYKYASVNTYVRVDTAKLRDYAYRLDRVNSRLSALDQQMNSLYWRVNLVGLWNLIQADALTSYSWKIRKCSNYLKDTASDFEVAERYIASQA